MLRLAEFISFRLCYAMVFLLYKTYRFKHLQEHNRALAQAEHGKGAYLLSCWHEQLIAIALAQKGHPFCPLVSRSFAGRLVAYSLRKWGFTPIFGSQNRNGKDKGGKQARQETLALCEQGLPSAFTVDGSIGPRRKVKPGVVDVASKSGAAIMPVACVSDRFWEFATWDRLKLPKPFAQVVVAYGPPIRVPQGLGEEAFNEHVERVAQGINRAEQDAAHFLFAATGVRAELPGSRETAREASH